MPHLCSRSGGQVQNEVTCRVAISVAESSCKSLPAFMNQQQGLLGLHNIKL